MLKKLSIVDLPLHGKKILMRVDFNVPLNKNGEITDDTRIVASLPSINYVLEHGGALILMSHLGRPKGKKASESSLAPCAKRLSEMLGKPVLLAPDCVGPETEKLAKSLKPGEIMLLENLRFHQGEEHPDEDPNFAKQLASMGDFYVNDAFGAAHRAHSSITEIAKYFPGKSATGFLLEKEISFLGKALLEPRRPFCAIIGGAKISTKIGVIESLLHKADVLLIGGGMAYTFYKAQGWSIGNSLHEDAFVAKAKDLLKISGNGAARLILPLDNVVADKVEDGAVTKITNASEGIPEGYQGVDIGPKTIQKFTEELKKASTILWNGPLGVFEIKEFAKGTNAIAQVVSELNATTIVGGGDSIAALQQAGLADKISHLSTGGGASLEYIEYGTLPGVDALSASKAAS